MIDTTNNHKAQVLDAICDFMASKSAGRRAKIPEIKMATFAEAAKTNIEQNESYKAFHCQSSRLKEKIGCVLIACLQRPQYSDDWRLFDFLLRRHISLSTVESMKAIQPDQLKEVNAKC